MKRAAMLVAALVIARPELVLAGSTCGSHDSGGGSSSSSNSSTDSSRDTYSSSSSSTVTPTCHETTDVLGYRECTRFGAWGDNLRLPRLFIELGTATRIAPSLAGNHSGNIAHATESFAYRTIDAPEAVTEHQIVTGLRMGVGFTRGIFVAVDLEGGPIVRGTTRTEMTGSGVFGSPTLAQDTAVAMNAAGVVGIRRPVGHGMLGVEVAGGVRAVQYSFTSSYHDCETTTLYAEAAPLLEARASYEHWLHPYITVGGTLGASVIDHGSWMGSLHLGFHTRAFADSH